MDGLLQAVKIALRISHNKLDAEIDDTIKAARAELIRLGIAEQKANAIDDSLITDAIKIYCKYTFAADEKQRDGYFISWQYQADCLRKTDNYRGGAIV